MFLNDFLKAPAPSVCSDVHTVNTRCPVQLAVGGILFAIRPTHWLVVTSTHDWCVAFTHSQDTRATSATLIVNSAELCNISTCNLLKYFIISGDELHKTTEQNHGSDIMKRKRNRSRVNLSGRIPNCRLKK